MTEARGDEAHDAPSGARRWLVPALLAAVAVALRWLPGGRLSLGVDDGVSVLDAQPPLLEIFGRMRSLGEVHPPLYFWYLHPWVTVLRPGAFESGGLEPWFHASSLPWALAVVGLTGGLGAHLGGRRVGLGAALLAAVSNLLVFHALEVRMYAMLTCFIVGAVWAAAARRPAIAGICGALAFLTHYEAVFFLAALGLWCALQPVEERRRWRVCALGLGVLIAAWTPLLLQQAGAQPLHLRQAPSWPQLIEVLFEQGWGVTWPLALPGWNSADGALPLPRLAGLITLAIVIGGLRRASAGARRLLVCVLVVPLVLVFGVSILTSLRVFEYKYLQPLCPFVCVATAMWLGRDATARASRFGVGVVAAVAAVNLTAWAGFAQAAQWYGPQDWRGVVEAVAPALGPDEPLLVHPSMMAAPVLVYAYLGERRLFSREGQSRVVPVDEASSGVFIQALADAPRAWLLTTPAHPFVAQQRLLERLPSGWTAYPVGETASYWPANRIQVFRLTRAPVVPSRVDSGSAKTGIGSAPPSGGAAPTQAQGTRQRRRRIGHEAPPP